MSRLTRKDYKNLEQGTGYYNKKKCQRLTETMHKLGYLEDILEKYNIDSVEELDIVLECAIKNQEKIIDLSADLGMYQNENTKLTEDVVFKVLMLGITVKNNDDLIDSDYADKEEKYVNFSPDEIYIKNYPSYGLHNSITHSIEIVFGVDGEWSVYLKDYKKTWWVRGER